MENNKNKQTGLVKTTNSLTLSTLSSMDDVEVFVERIATSKNYNRNFVSNVTDKDGNTTEYVDRSAIANVLLLGNEFGFKPIESILLYRDLSTPDAVIKIHKGRDLGLSAINAIQNIYTWIGENGQRTVYTSIHVIYKCLTDAGVVKTILEDGTQPCINYYAMDGSGIEYDEAVHIPINIGTSPKELEIALKAGRIPIKRITTYRACVKLTRGEESIAIPYNSQQAIDAGLYRGTDSFGDAVKGKKNWNAHLAAHLIKMSVMNGARMIIGDKLQGGIYIPEELPINEVEDVHGEVVD